jgi:hypothetical protein
MTASRWVWLRVALLAGVGYFVIGKVFAIPTNGAQFWRLAAWVASAAVYAAHIGYEHYSLHSPPHLGAAHVALAVGLGALLLALAGAVHDLSTASAIRATWGLALVVWPVVTAAPAFLGALVAGLLLARRSRRTNAD